MIAFTVVPLLTINATDIQLLAQVIGEETLWQSKSLQVAVDPSLKSFIQNLPSVYGKS